MQDAAVQHVLWLGIGTETWAIVAATALGPIFAILITRWRDWVRERRARRMHIFRTLLSTRRQAINPEHVIALNLVEVDFYGVTSIEMAWRSYNQHLNSAPRGRKMTPEEDEAFGNTRNDLLAKLLFAIAHSLGFKMSELDLRNGGYSPEGWKTREDRIIEIQDFILNIAKGSHALPVLNFFPPQREQQNDSNGLPKG